MSRVCIFPHSSPRPWPPRECQSEMTLMVAGNCSGTLGDTGETALLVIFWCFPLKNHWFPCKIMVYAVYVWIFSGWGRWCIECYGIGFSPVVHGPVATWIEAWERIARFKQRLHVCCMSTGSNLSRFNFVSNHICIIFVVSWCHRLVIHHSYGQCPILTRNSS